MTSTIRARLLIAGGQNNAAASLLEKAIRRSPNAWMALQQLALIELSRGREGRALKLARRAVSIEKNAPLAHLVIASVLQNLGQRQRAKAAFRRYLELCPTCKFAREVRFVLRHM